MIYVFLGKDFSIVKKRVDDLVSKLNINNIIKFDDGETSIRDILEEINYIDLFNEKKLLIVSDFSFKKLKSNDEELLSKYINNMNDNVIIIKCIDESLDERKSLTKLLKSKCKVEKIEHLDYKNLHDYISNMFKDNKIKATFNQVKKILDLCNYNPDYTINEVEKLLIYKIGENELYDEDIDNVISKNTEKEIFTFVESVLNKDLKSILESYEILTSGNMDEIAIIDALAKQYRLLYQVKIMYRSLNEQALASRFGVNPYTIKKIMPYIGKYSEEEIADLLYKLSEVDSDIKIKGYDKKRAMESFFFSL